MSNYDLKDICDKQDEVYSNLKTELTAFQKDFKDVKQNVTEITVNNEVDFMHIERILSTKSNFFLYHFEYENIDPEKTKAIIKTIKAMATFNNSKRETAKKQEKLKNSIKCLKEKYPNYRNEISLASEITKTYGLPKVSSSNHSTTSLYVGSSRPNAIKRFKEHILKDQSPTTFALHLGLWGQIAGIDRVSLTTIAFCEEYFEPKRIKVNGKTKTVYNQTKLDLFQNVEDMYHEANSPILGKQGGM